VSEDLVFVSPKPSKVELWENRFRRIFLIAVIAAVIFLFAAPFVIPVARLESFRNELVLFQLHVQRSVPSPQLPKPISYSDNCGNGTCDVGESRQNCWLDCFACNGNDRCDRTVGENQLSCPTDCPSQYS